MELVTVCDVHRAATVFLLLYPVAAYLLVRRGRADAVPLVLTPLFVGLTATWLGLTNLQRALDVSGGGRPVIRAAGGAEALLLVVFAAVIATLTASAAFFRRPPHATPSARARLAGTILTMLLIALTIAAIWAAAWSPVRAPAGFATGTLIAAAISATAGIASLVWLIRGEAVASRTTTAIAAIASAIIGGVAWQVIEELRAIAMAF